MLQLTQIPRPDYAGHPAYGKLFGAPSLQTRRTAWQRFFPQFKSEFRSKWRFERNRKKIADPQAFGLYQQMRREGVVAMRVAEDDYERIRALCEPHVNALVERRSHIPPEKRKFMDNVEQVTQVDKPLVEQLQALVQKLGIWRASEMYLGKRLNWLAVFIQINDDTDLHLKNHFADVGLEDPPTRYMHLDSSMDIMKAILYYTEVSEETGPFSFVPGSNNFQMGMIEFAARKANDKANLDKCDRATREQFWALPSIFQHKSEFGNDLLSNAPSVDALLARERRFTSKDGNLIFFDNNRGIHRGSLVQKGQRVIVQLQMG